MSTIFDYLTWRGDLDFSRSPFNLVDNIILCQIAYLPFDGIVPGPDERAEISVKDAIHILYQKLQDKDECAKLPFLIKEDSALISALRYADRFGNCRLRGYVNHIDTGREIQFSALCINTGDGSHFIAYRGTDMTFVGWKEDFNMSFSKVVPAQLAAVEYLVKMAKKIKSPLLQSPLLKGPLSKGLLKKGSLRIGGHSKGGNLAAYAASQCGKKIQRRITAVYSNDAPGFHESVIASEGFAAIKERIHTFIPQSSVVGMLFEHGTTYKVIKSSGNGLLQHEIYTWEVTFNDMVYADDVTQGSRFVSKTLKDWITTLDNTHREQFIEALYSILCASKAKTIPELEHSWPKSAARMLQSLGDIDESTRNIIKTSLTALFHSARNNIDTLLKKQNK
jgi:hypothetical protein